MMSHDELNDKLYYLTVYEVVHKTNKQLDGSVLGLVNNEPRRDFKIKLGVITAIRMQVVEPINKLCQLSYQFIISD
jgi:hypothetical protein